MSERNDRALVLKGGTVVDGSRRPAQGLVQLVGERPVAHPVEGYERRGGIEQYGVAHRTGLATEQAAPYELDINTSSLADGAHQLCRRREPVLVQITDQLKTVRPAGLRLYSIRHTLSDHFDEHVKKDNPQTRKEQNGDRTT